MTLALKKDINNTHHNEKLEYWKSVAIICLFVCVTDNVSYNVPFASDVTFLIFC